MRTSKCAAVVAALTLLLALVLAAPAGASRAASKQQRRALTRAIHRSPVAGLNQIPTSDYIVRGQRISTVSRNWATARTEAAPGHEATFQPGYVIAIQPAGTRTWVVVDAGSSEVGCGIAPDAVIADLLGVRKSQACPGGSGIG